MTIAQGDSSLPGFERILCDDITTPSNDWWFAQDRYRVFHMPAFVRKTGKRTTDRTFSDFKMDWYMWLENKFSPGADDDVSATVTVNTGPIERNNKDSFLTPFEGDFVVGKKNVSVSMTHEETLSGATSSTPQWGSGGNSDGESCPVFADGNPQKSKTMTLPIDKVIGYGPEKNKDLEFGFLRFVVWADGGEPFGGFIKNLVREIGALFIEELRDDRELFPALLGEGLDGNSVDTPYHESMPVSSYLLRHAQTMLDRYEREAKYISTIIMGEMYSTKESTYA